MSVQIFLLGRISGAGPFLLAPAASDPDRTFLGRATWLDLVIEVLPRALLSELGLSRMLLGSSGGDEFLLLLPEESRAQAEAFMQTASDAISALTAGAVALSWAVTENLGDWTAIRKRFAEDFTRRRAGSPPLEPGFFAPFDASGSIDNEYFATTALRLRSAASVGWSPESPAQLLPETGTHTYELGTGPDQINVGRHAAHEDDSDEIASTATLAARASGQRAWGVLRGDVDAFTARMRRADSVEDHLKLAVMYKTFFAGELQFVCNMGEPWRKSIVANAGPNEFAVIGSWDVLLPLAREIQRMFHRFADENLKEYPGAEGKTITMAVALSQSPDEAIAPVYEQAGISVQAAKTAGKDSIYAFGRVLAWKELAEASDLKDALMNLVAQRGASSGSIRDLAAVCRETQGTRKKVRIERPWRFARKVNRVLPAGRDREAQKARADVVAGLVGRRTANWKLHDSGRAALEWARLAEGKIENG